MRVLLSSIALLFAGSLSAAQYMHINTADGKEYDVKIEKTDRVSHVKKDGENYIKVLKTNDTYSLYPLEGSDVTFDDEIARVEQNVSDWKVVNSMIEGCVLDTSNVEGIRQNGGCVDCELLRALDEYESCVYKAQRNKKVIFNDNEKNTIHNANRESVNLLLKLIEENDNGENMIFSPTSFQFAMAMLANGADDDGAYAELSKALGYENMPLDSLNVLFNKRMQKLKLSDPGKISVGIVNANFLQNDVMFGKNYLQNMSDYYHASANNVNFSDDTTYALMDEWAKKSTNGMIPSLGLQKNPNLVMVLANALSFQSEWATKFDKDATVRGDFMTSKGEKKTVKKMRGSWGSYGESDNFQMATLSFYEDFEMNIVLPKDGITPQNVLSTFDFKRDYTRRGHNAEMNTDTIFYPNLKLPKFNVDCKHTLNDAMKKMGMERCFLRSYENMATGAQIEKVQQLTHLEIDEDGAKGAAVTTVSMAGTAFKIYQPVEFDVNRPFIVSVTNRSTGEVLFLGIINDPTAGK